MLVKDHTRYASHGQWMSKVEWKLQPGDFPIRQEERREREKMALVVGRSVKKMRGRRCDGRNVKRDWREKEQSCCNGVERLPDANTVASTT